MDEKHIICRTVNSLDDIVLVDNLFQAEVIRVSHDDEKEVILTLLTTSGKIVQIHLNSWE